MRQYQIIRTEPQKKPRTGSFITICEGGKNLLLTKDIVDGEYKNVKLVKIQEFKWEDYCEPRYITISAAKLLGLDEQLIIAAEHPVQKRLHPGTYYEFSVDAVKVKGKRGAPNIAIDLRQIIAIVGTIENWHTK